MSQCRASLMAAANSELCSSRYIDFSSPGNLDPVLNISTAARGGGKVHPAQDSLQHKSKSTPLEIWTCRSKSTLYHGWLICTPNDLLILNYNCEGAAACNFPYTSCFLSFFKTNKQTNKQKTEGRILLNSLCGVLSKAWGVHQVYPLGWRERCVNDFRHWLAGRGSIRLFRSGLAQKTYCKCQSENWGTRWVPTVAAYKCSG